ncbi:MAG: anaerobic ribonucleoside-triphosphate reductase activating protein [Candidatus Andersenbacteria bacterium]
MIIGGLQKLSLVDYPGKVCSIVFTQGCTFRCSYCHNPALVVGPAPKALSMKRVLDYLKKHADMLDAVCVTGGEPTLHRDLDMFLRQIKKSGLKVKLDTNGLNPETIQRFIQEGLVDYFAMDIKAPWRKYGTVMQTSQTIGIERCKKTFAVIQNSGVAHEFRTTVFPSVHTEPDFMEMVSYLKPGEHYYLQNVRYAVTLDPKIDRTIHLDVPAIAQTLRQRYPEIIIIER